MSTSGRPEGAAMEFVDAFRQTDLGPGHPTSSQATPGSATTAAMSSAKPQTPEKVKSRIMSSSPGFEIIERPEAAKSPGDGEEREKQVDDEGEGGDGLDEEERERMIQQEYEEFVRWRTRRAEGLITPSPTRLVSQQMRIFEKVMDQTPNFRREIFRTMREAAHMAPGANVDNSGGSQPPVDKTNDVPSAAADEDLITDAPGAQSLFAHKRVSPHPVLISMLEGGWHVPLTAFTTRALHLLSLQGGLDVRTKQALAPGGGIAVIPDFDDFGKEETMSSEDWREAWGHFLVLLPQILGPRECTRFREHFQYICDHYSFRTGFGALLAFDIELRNGWFTAPRNAKPPFVVGDQSYLWCINKWENIAAQKARDEAAARLRLSGPSHGRGGFHPYGRKETNYGGFGGGFGGNGLRGGGAHRSNVLCLVCGEDGHVSSSCSRTTITATGRPAFCSSFGGNLIGVYSGARICPSWNLGGALPCRGRNCPATANCHVCCYCGDTDHNGATKRCFF